MVPGTRFLKQIIVALLTVVILGGGGFAAVRHFHPPPPTPTPDPRAALKPIDILSTQLFRVSDHDYDFLANVQNPNTRYGSGNVGYELDFSDEGGKVVKTMPGTFYILPGQTKYVINTPLKFDVAVAKATMKITSVLWQELDPLALSGVTFVVTTAGFHQSSPSSATVGAVGGSVTNNSDFDISRVDVVVVLFDAAGKPIATNRTEIRTFLAHTARGFETAWFSPIAGTIARTSAEANTNLFENDAFIRTYGGQERFQAY